ncbi:LOW QUALITY PROTEIN: leucine-rich repeat serine/threonine-protein kinase 1 [Drosophila sulfurigaster albostrigata]|uniref:LOW QUALITY PROTEIN: leucine-rich repeat serine/threonine-protein kinase 1 n=1 Tax=Drosophila sulfurigaster albostrigata TaxID=89887 RepID=UPI002D219DC0|nr:LOW QUALITY PROTEIN: leucine-rich repeat serine/threonine-protein kinase 1 [Drosophila sulfurigaster albostrigata]
MSWKFVGQPKAGTETALEACDYFVDEVIEVSGGRDAREEVRQIKHGELRAAVSAGDERTVRVLLEALGRERQIIVNMAPAGANTLLFLACQSGFESITQRLLDAGADGRSHAVTKYSPLYAAVHNGHYGIAKLMLDRFPELIQQATVERWLPLHAACINGHIKLLELIIGFAYPDYLYQTYRDEEGQWEWRLPFDANAQDVTGQTSLYIASLLGNKQLLGVLLKWQLRCRRTISVEDGSSSTTSATAGQSTPITPTRKRISFGIQAIMSKLHISGEGDTLEAQTLPAEQESQRCPIHINLLCGAARETALLAAVRGGHLDVAQALLQHGANPNIVAKPVEDHNDPKCSEEIYGLSNVPIAEACKQRSLAMLDLLLKFGARDDNGTAISVAIASEDEALLSRLLARRVHPDSDYKINKKGLPTPLEVNVFLPSASNISYSAMFPNVPTIIDWHSLSMNVQLPFVRCEWLVSGVLQLNPKLTSHPRLNEVALTAITRIDFSHNVLTSIPPELFNLVSLKYLNVAQNKITELPAPLAKSYNCPVLDELFLQDNQLTSLPAAIFQLPALTILDISNNKLQQLPFDMWRAPKLRELNVAFNLLRELPVPPMQTSGSLLSLDKLQLLQSFDEPSSNKPHTLCQQTLTHRNLWSTTLDITDNDLKWQQEQEQEQEQAAIDGKAPPHGASQLSSLNIANNLFTSIPAALPCLAVNLTRLNMSYNSLRSMGHVTSYPATLKQLDLSHNEISCWPSLPRITDSDPNLLCYSYVQLPEGSSDEPIYKTPAKGSSCSFRASVLKSVCRHRRHLRLEALRTLILADNLLTRIQLSTDDATTLFNESEDADWSVVGVNKSKVIFPNLSMLDMTNNCLKEIPASLHELSSLSVLNISGNVQITELPPHLGLLSRLWNLNTRGCLLQEPLRSMIESKKHKTMDIVGYLKSIYEDAQPYARMKLMVVGSCGIGKTTLLDLLRQGVGSGSSSASAHRSRANENHWAKRMGHSRSTSRSQRRANISTVGVDIGTWICEKRKRATGCQAIVFRTWDFGGQKEYYATHQYFLSKRSLYLVLWRISDGHKGLAELLQWLGNIQARAPNSPVLIVGTHFDTVGESISAQQAEQLQQLIREKFIAIPDAEKIGLPRVIDSIEISCRTMHNIHLLANIIYDTAMQLRSPGSKEPMLLQKIPASYIALEDIVNVIACNLRAAGRDPVLDAEQYRSIVTEQMRLHNYKSFRDAAELQQATTWCHDNGILLHYDDATLRDYYFLDPQWLCDMLAHVVTVREINPFAPTGVMKLDDLQLLFRSVHAQGNGNRSYIVSLLNKFEVALTWDSRTLLIPSLLPLQEAATYNDGTTVKLLQRVRGRSHNLGCSVSQELNLNKLIYEQHSPRTPSTAGGLPSQGLRRMLLMTYFPSGFWSRLITRVLADEQIIEAIRGVYVAAQDKYLDFDLRGSLEQDTQWNLWQTGVALYYGPILIFRIWEVPFQSTERTQPFRTASNRFKLKLDGIWSDVNLCSSSILDVYFPLFNVSIYQELDAGERQLLAELQPQMSQVAKLLALVVDHIDLLLEDWYPALGTRFVHTSEGRFLITRLVLCPRCLRKLQLQNGAEPVDREPNFNGNRPSRSSKRGPYFLHGVGDPGDDGALNVFSAYLNATASRERHSADSLGAGSDADSGVGPDSAFSSRNTSIDGHPAYASHHLPDNSNVCYAWMVEECILSVYNQSKLSCPVHLEQSMAQLAPDVIFADIPDKHTIATECIIKGSLLGRGAFGFVFKASCKLRGARAFRSVAMKMLQPVPPGARAKESALMAYKVALGKWDRDPLQHSCKAYCTARQELAVLLTLKHPNIVPLVGICIKPLALVLELAPLGGLDALLRQYRRSGAHMGPHTFQMLVVQAARAIEYLHRRRIIYRDLKSENVLVWELPQPHSEDSPRNQVHIKIADYGISRQTAAGLSAKGFGGTEGFMAPEIIRFNGEEEYTEKVDCFSFGMFIYENISLRQPFEGHESIKECILEGSRPALTQRETQFPTCCLDLMVLCWHEQPRRRPSASQIVSILSAPECIHLLDVVALPHSDKIVCGAFQLLTAGLEEDRSGLELWLPAFGSRIDILDVSPTGSLLQCSSISCAPQPQVAAPKTPENSATSRARSAQRIPKVNMLCCCLVGEAIWMGDVSGNLHAYSTTSYAHLFSYMLDPAIKSAVISLVYMEGIARVAVGLHNGRVFLVDASRMPSNCAFAEGSFVLTEICSGFVLHASCSVLIDGVYELWCGEIAGKINVFPVNEAGVCGHQALCHSEEPNLIEDVKVSRLCSNDSHVFSCLYPGCMVYQWGAASKRIENKLDCSKLLPCSESLQSIAIDEHVNLIKCQISALAAHNTELYIGTTWGCLIVAELQTLRPISVFRPYENEIKAIITMRNAGVPLIATLGRRYRSLISRYVDTAESTSRSAGSVVSTPTHGAAKSVPPADVDNHIHCLLWRAKHWT